jgi:hypothetical protein
VSERPQFPASSFRCAKPSFRRQAIEKPGSNDALAEIDGFTLERLSREPDVFLTFLSEAPSPSPGRP